jgi:hypothetical protein
LSMVEIIALVSSFIAETIKFRYSKVPYIPS